MRKRSGVARKFVIPPAQPCKGQWLRRTLWASSSKDGTWPTTKPRLRRDRSSVASAPYNARETCSLHSKQSRGLVTTWERKWAALRAPILSGIPTITIPSFPQCPVSGRGLFLGTHGRRPRQMPLAREDIPHISHLTSSTPPPGQEVSPNFDLWVFTQGCGAVWQVR